MLRHRLGFDGVDLVAQASASINHLHCGRVLGGGAHFSAAEPSPRAGPEFIPGGPWSLNPRLADGN